jgi:hypothetical protein
MARSASAKGWTKTAVALVFGGGRGAPSVATTVPASGISSRSREKRTFPKSKKGISRPGPRALFPGCFAPRHVSAALQ